MFVKTDNTTQRSSLELTFSVLTAVYKAGSEGILTSRIVLAAKTNHGSVARKLNQLEEAAIVECTKEEGGRSLRSRITDKGISFYHEYASFMQQNSEFHTSATIKRDILGALRAENGLTAARISTRIGSIYDTVLDRGNELVAFGLLKPIAFARTDNAYSITQTGMEKYLSVDKFLRTLSDLNIRI